MSDIYRLVFRGEVLEGQHPAVVRRRLGEQLGIDSARLDRLFSGQPVIVKAEADAGSAARLQGLFRKAGARLRVAPIQSGPSEQTRSNDGRGEEDRGDGSTPQAAGNAAPQGDCAPVGDSVPVGNAVPVPITAPAASVAAALPGEPAAEAFDPDILPVGSDVLREEEREEWQPREIDTSHLGLQDPDRLRYAIAPPTPPPPDTSHLGMLDP